MMWWMVLLKPFRGLKMQRNFGYLKVGQRLFAHLWQNSRRRAKPIPARGSVVIRLDLETL